MPRAERKKTVGVPESAYKEMAQYATKHNLFIGEVVELAWNTFQETFGKSTKKRKRKRRKSKVDLIGAVKKTLRYLSVFLQPLMTPFRYWEYWKAR